MLRIKGFSRFSKTILLSVDPYLPQCSFILTHSLPLVRQYFQRKQKEAGFPEPSHVHFDQSQKWHASNKISLVRIRAYIMPLFGKLLSVYFHGWQICNIHFHFAANYAARQLVHMKCTMLYHVWNGRRDSESVMIKREYSL